MTKRLKKKPKYTGFDNVLLKTILGYSIWIFLSVIVDKINWNLDNFLLGVLSGTVSVSIYSLSSQINQMYIMFSTAISGVLLPYSSKMVAKNYSDKKLTEFLTKTGRIQLYIVGLIISGFIIFGKDCWFVELLYFCRRKRTRIRICLIESWYSIPYLLCCFSSSSFSCIGCC